MAQNNDSVVHELKLALYDMIRVARALIDNRGTILSARKRIEAAEKILNKNFNIHDVLRSDPSGNLTDNAALQSKCDRYEKVLKEIGESTCDYEDVNYKQLHSTECRACRANEVLSGEGKEVENEG